KFQRSDPGRSNTDFGRRCWVFPGGQTSNSRSRRETSVLRPMISARTARIDDNLGRGTDGSNPVPSSEESAANFAHLMLSKLDQFGGDPQCTLTAAYSNLSSTTVDEQLDTGDVGAVVGSEEHRRFAPIIRR